ncbi:unnamed protein product, partial [Mesorhabditis belari]|uniref:Globin family profile domain-containing protein n=1 Tax=Mesorhabditis belari TaxID=2138241 RepID=A0AAF3FTQ9_9BILA
METEATSSRAIVERTIRSAVKAVCRYSSPQRSHHPQKFAQLLKRCSKASITDHVFILSSFSGRALLADNDEIDRICEDYSRIPDKYALFEKMFMQLFMDEDFEFAVHFSLVSPTEESLRNEQKFRTHVGKFQRFMNYLMDMLSKGAQNGEQIVHMLRIIGRQHTNVRSMSFTAEKWLIFKNAMLSLLCPECDLTYPTWSKLISFVIYEIKDSYLEHFRQLRSSSCPQIAQLTIIRKEQCVMLTKPKKSTSRKESMAKQ